MRLVELKDKQFEPNKLKQTPEELATILNANCQQIIKAFKIADVPLLRGVHRGRGPSFVANIRSDRKTIDIDKHFHEVLHQAYLNNGLKATRKNSIFCTTDFDEAAGWGTTAIVFPLDGWEGTVFEQITHGLTYDNAKDLEDDWLGMKDEGESEKDTMDEINRRVGRWKPLRVTPANMPQVLQDWDEILITGKSYIGLNVDEDQHVEYVSKVLQILGLDFPELEEHFD